MKESTKINLTKNIPDSIKLKKLVDHYMWESWTPIERTTKELLESFEEYIKKIKECRNEDIDNEDIDNEEVTF